MIRSARPEAIHRPCTPESWRRATAAQLAAPKGHSWLRCSWKNLPTPQAHQLHCHSNQGFPALDEDVSTLERARGNSGTGYGLARPPVGSPSQHLQSTIEGGEWCHFTKHCKSRNPGRPRPPAALESREGSPGRLSLSARADSWQARRRNAADEVNQVTHESSGRLVSLVAAPVRL